MSGPRFTRDPSYRADRPVPDSVRDWVRSNMTTRVSLVTLAEDGATKTPLFERKAGRSMTIAQRCAHTDAVPVESGEEIVAALCLSCDRQLPAEWLTCPHNDTIELPTLGIQPPYERPLQRLRNRLLPGGNGRMSSACLGCVPDQRGATLRIAR